MKPPLLVTVAVLVLGLPLAQAEVSLWSAKLSQAQQLYENRQFSEAIVSAEAALTIAERQVGRESPELTSILSFLGTLYSTKAAFDEKPSGNRRAIVYLGREASILRKQSTPDAKRRLVASLFLLGQACETVRNLVCAIDSYEQAIGAAEPLEGNPDSYDAEGLWILARLRGERKEFARAEAVMHRYIAIRERAAGIIHPLDQVYSLAAEAFANWHNDAEAERLYWSAIREAKSREGYRDPNCAFLDQAASFFISLTRYDQAQSLLDQALFILQAAREVHGAAQIYAHKATICKLLGDRPGAMVFLDQANRALKALPPNIVIAPYTYAQLPSKPSLARHRR